MGPRLRFRREAGRRACSGGSIGSVAAVEPMLQPAEERSQTHRAVEVILRFALAGCLLGVLLIAGFSGSGYVLLTVALVLVAVLAAAVWAVGRISGVAMYNLTLGVLGLSVLGASSSPGGGDFGQLLILLGAVVAAGLAWIILLNNRLGDESGKSLRPFLVGPAIAVVVVAGIRTGMPERIRFALSESAFDHLAENPLSLSGGYDRGALIEVTSGVPSHLGLYDVKSVRVGRPGEPRFLQVVVVGDCGWFDECTLTYSPGSDESEAGHQLGDWHANW